MKRLIFSAMLALSFGLTSNAQTSRDLGNGTFHNPVIWADVPDVCVIRVDDNYYMVSTTMHMSPGCTIMKSKDLVNWSVAGYAHDELEEMDAFALKNGQNDYSKGSWAANIRYDKYEKMFYLIVTCNTTQKSYIMTTKDIEHGPWHRNEVSLCYDPGFLFEDTGTECKKYVVHPDFSMDSNKAFITEISSDGKGNVTLGEHKKILDYSQADNPRVGLRAEGYHGYKIGDYYYIFMIEGGRGKQWRQQICWRSKKLFGDNWEVRKVFVGNMVNPDGTVFQESGGIAQGNIVQTQDGKWYAMLFQDQGAVGRMPVLISMKWSEDGWPIIGNDGKSADAIMDIPVSTNTITKTSKPSIVVSDEFNNGKEADRCIISDKYANSLGKGGEYDLTSSILKKEWQWNHNPDNRYWSLTERKGWLRLNGGIMAHNIRDARNTLTQRTFGPECTAETVLDTRGMKDGDCAGLTLFQNQYGYVGVEVTDGQKYIVMRRAAEKNDADGIIIEKLPLKASKVYLRAHGDFTDRKDLGDFAYSLDGKNWKSIGDTLHMKYDFPDFMGYRFGLFYFPTKSTGGHADFDFFHVK